MSVELKTKIVPKVQKPSLYDVILLNDDYTTMQFVEEVLKRHFNKAAGAARVIMMQVHTKGAAVAGTYTLDIADTKATQVMDEAKAREFPLRVELAKR